MGTRSRTLADCQRIDIVKCSPKLDLGPTTNLSFLRERVPVRSITRWIVLILFATLSVLGQGTHLLIGCACAGHCSATANSPEHCHRHACCEHGHPCTLLAEEEAVDASPRISAPPAHDPRHCLICRFLAQGQLRTLPPEVAVSFYVQPFQRPQERISLAAARYEPYGARAPPGVS
jgi:hypothetical protein